MSQAALPENPTESSQVEEWPGLFICYTPEATFLHHMLREQSIDGSDTNAVLPIVVSQVEEIHTHYKGERRRGGLANFDASHDDEGESGNDEANHLNKLNIV